MYPHDGAIGRIEVLQGLIQVSCSFHIITRTIFTLLLERYYSIGGQSKDSGAKWKGQFCSLLSGRSGKVLSFFVPQFPQQTGRKQTVVPIS